MSEQEAKAKPASAAQQKATVQSVPDDPRYEVVKEILSKETFIDPLNDDEITKAYSQYTQNPNKILDVMVASFQAYCRKAVREAAVLRVKNEIATLPYEEAESLKNKAIQELSLRVQKDESVDRLISMLLFKHHFWAWVVFGLKDIFNAQRQQPGHKINQYLNVRFHQLKAAKGYKKVGDLVASDVTEICNAFKKTILEKKIRIFENISS